MNVPRYVYVVERCDDSSPVTASTNEDEARDHGMELVAFMHDTGQYADFDLVTHTLH